jgi:hypothetical protein
MATTQLAQPRQQFYTFAHRVLKQDAHEEPKLWSFITGDSADGYAQMRWHDAGEAAGEQHPPDKLLWVAPQHERGLDIAVLHMPPPNAPTEAYYAAFVRDPKRPFPLRYFVLERNSSGGAHWAEWRPNMRIRGADVEEFPKDMQRRIALPLPYLATFIDSIVDEITSSPPLDTPMPASSAAKPNNKVALYLIIGAVVLMALVFLSRF